MYVVANEKNVLNAKFSARNVLKREILTDSIAKGASIMFRIEQLMFLACFHVRSYNHIPQWYTTYTCEP